MKKLLLLVTLMLSFNVSGEWVYIDKEKNSDAEVYVLTESIEVDEEYVYWTYLNNYSKPRSEYNIMGLAIFRGGDCKNNRYVNIESQMFQGSMGSKPFADRLKHEQEWITPTSGQIDEKMFNYVCDLAGFGSVQYEEEGELTVLEKIAKATGDQEPIITYHCDVLAEYYFWDDAPHVTKGDTKKFIFRKDNKTVRFQKNSPFNGASLDITMEEESSFGPRFEASSDNSKLMYFYADERNIYGDRGRFKYTNLGVDSGIMGMFSSILATCKPSDRY